MEEWREEGNRSSGVLGKKYSLVIKMRSIYIIGYKDKVVGKGKVVVKRMFVGYQNGRYSKGETCIYLF